MWNRAPQCLGSADGGHLNLGNGLPAGLVGSRLVTVWGSAVATSIHQANLATDLESTQNMHRIDRLGGYRAGGVRLTFLNGIVVSLDC